MATNDPINPRVRAFGKARIDIAGRATNQAEWEKLWKQPSQPFPFTWGEAWKQCVEYKVNDFPAEVGFFIDVLGLPVNAFNTDHAMFTSPDGDFFFSVIPTPLAEQSTPPDSFRIQFLVRDITSTTQTLEQRGIDFTRTLQPLNPGSSLLTSSFRTPNGIVVELWGRAMVNLPEQVEMRLAETSDDGDEGDDGFEEDDDESVGEEDTDDGDEGEEGFGKSDGNGETNSDEDEDESEGDEELEEDEANEDEDEFEEDDDNEYDNDDDDGDLDWDEDEDDFDEDEDASSINPNPIENAAHTRTSAADPDFQPQDTLAGGHKEQGPEYIDLD